MGALLSAGLYLLPDGYTLQTGAGRVLSAPTVWHHYIAPALLGPPVIASLLWLAHIVCSVIGRALVAAIVGGLKSFSR